MLVNSLDTKLRNAVRFLVNSPRRFSSVVSTRWLLSSTIWLGDAVAAVAAAALCANTAAGAVASRAEAMTRDRNERFMGCFMEYFPVGTDWLWCLHRLRACRRR